MAEPARSHYDEDEADNNLPLSAQERANRKWGMSPEQQEERAAAIESASKSQQDGSAYERAQRAWNMTPQSENGLNQANLSQKLDDKYGNFKSTAGPNNKSGMNAGDLAKKEDDTEAAGVSGANVDSKEVDATSGSTEKSLNYTGNKGKAEGKGKFSAKASFAKKRVKLAIAGAIFSVIVSVITFIGLLPLKLAHIISNVDKKFFATAEEAIETRSEKFFSKYVSSHVLRSLTDADGTCPSTRVNKNCSVTVNENGPLSRLYRAWADDRLEQKLSENYGLTFERSGNTYNMNIRGERIDITGVARGDLELRDVGRYEIRQSWKEAFKNETRLKRVFYHFKVGRLLERKFGIKRCIVACRKRLGFDDWKGHKAKVFKTKLIRRVLSPRDEALTIAFQCIFVEPCSTDPDSTGPDNDKRDLFQSRVDEMLERLSREYGNEFTKEGIEKMLKELDDLDRNGGGRKYKQYIAKKILQKVFEDETADTLAKVGTKVIPIYGWVQLATTITRQLDQAGPKIRKYRYVAGSVAMIQMYSMYKTFADEIKRGDVDPKVVGSFIEALSDGTKNGEPAEASPLYNSVINGPSKPTYGSIFSGRAYADTDSTSTTYTCDDGDPVPDGEYICEEEDLLGGTAITRFAEFLSDNPVVNNVLGPIAGGFGVVLDVIDGAINKPVEALLGIPGISHVVGAITNAATGILEPLMSAITGFLFPSALQLPMSGARAVNGIIGGGSAAGANTGHYTLGGAAMTVGEVSAIEEKRLQEDNARFASLSIQERLFSKDESRSMISQFAMAMPSSQSTAISSFIDMKPTSVFGNLLDTLRPKKAFAAPDPNAIARDPFGTIQYGYPLGSPDLDADPDIYTPEYCAQETAAWTDDYVSDDGYTELEIHNRTNPCLLEQAAITSAGGYFTDDVIAPQDQIASYEMEDFSEDESMSDFYSLIDSFSDEVEDQSILGQACALFEKSVASIGSFIKSPYPVSVIYS